MKKAIDTYRELLSQLSSKLIDSLTRFDTLCLYLAMIIIFQVRIRSKILQKKYTKHLNQILILSVRLPVYQVFHAVVKFLM